MKAKTTNSTGHIYQPGDTVYFKREHSNSWKDAGTVLGLENKQVLVKYGGTCFRVHACCFQHAKKTETPSDNNKQEYDNNVNTNEIFDVNGDNDVVFDEIKQLNSNL